jgi:hypothetical protein
MGGGGRFASVMANAVLVLACSWPVHAQGNGNGKGNGHQSSPPSSSPLPGPTAGDPTSSGATPFAWIDDASVLRPGSMTVTISAMRWSAADLSEVDVPVVDLSVGLTPRVQIGAIIPHIVGSADGTGPVGGIGTSFLSGKYAVLTGTASGVKLAIAPMIEVLGDGAAQGLAPGESRTQFGLPVSMEIVHGPARVFASTGFFSGGVWFAGGGAGVQTSPRLAVSLSFSGAWASDALTGVARNRRQFSGGASYLVRPHTAVFGSLGRTIATAEADGAGTTVSGGVTFVVGPWGQQVARGRKGDR